MPIKSRKYRTFVRFSFSSKDTSGS